MTFGQCGEADSRVAGENRQLAFPTTLTDTCNCGRHLDKQFIFEGKQNEEQLYASSGGSCERVVSLTLHHIEAAMVHVV